MSIFTFIPIISLVCIFAIISLFLDNYGLGVFETIELIFTKKLKDRIRKIKLKQGDLVLLKTKGGAYPAKILLNKRRYKKIEVNSDSWLGWHVYYNYDDIELLDQETAKALYGGKGDRKK